MRNGFIHIEPHSYKSSSRVPQIQYRKLRSRWFANGTNHVRCVHSLRIWLKQLYDSVGVEPTLEPFPPTPTTTRDVLMRESPGDGVEEGVNEGIKSFFHSGIDLTHNSSFTSQVLCQLRSEPRFAEHVREEEVWIRRAVHYGYLHASPSSICTVKQAYPYRSSISVHEANIEGTLRRFFFFFNLSLPLLLRKCARSSVILPLPRQMETS